jgi:dTDP-4-amino-4,6-dideoxygalactose transaminase
MAQLAINGGTPLRKKDFHPWPVFDREEEEAVLGVLRSGKWWRYSFGEEIGVNAHHENERSRVAVFQEEFAKHQGSRFGIACSSGSAALDMAVRALHIGPGMEVIVPAYSFISSATCVLQSNAIPVFADIDPETFNLDPQKVSESIGPRTAAIIPCHFGGQVADMDKLQEITQGRGIQIIEDAAHAHGSKWGNRGAGSIGSCGTFSFQNSKNLTAGEGGIVITDDAETAHHIESLTWLGRHSGRPWYEHHRLGWNYRITEIQAAILTVQLTRLEEQNVRRRENASYLSSRLRDIGGIAPPGIDRRGKIWSVHLFIMRYDADAFKGLPRKIFVKALNAEGVPVSPGYTHPLYKNPMFLNSDFYAEKCPLSCSIYGGRVDYESFQERCPVSERMCTNEALWLEQRLFLGNRADMDDIAEAILKIKTHVEELL